MKLKGFFAAFTVMCLVACVFAFTAFADDIMYNVKLDPEVDLAQDASRWITVTEQELQRLLSQGHVEKYEQDFVMELCEYTADDPLYSSMWSPSFMNSEHAWSRGAFGRGVTVGIVDSGANAHVDLEGRITYAYSYVNTDTSDITDPIGHGTAVAGVIAANRGNSAGITGVAPRCDLAIFQVVTKDSGGNQVGLTVSMVSDAIEDAVDYGCDIINLSLGASNSYDRLEDAVAYARDNGVLLVAAAGNSGGTSHYYPASYDSVISVGSVDKNGTVAQTSQHNGTVNVVAPGVSVYTLSGTSKYVYKSGTSFSCPQVAGICAAMLSADTSLTREEVMEIVDSTAEDAGDAGYDAYYGNGYVDFGACIDSVVGDGIYISQIDIEDAAKNVYICGNTAGSYKLYANNSRYGLQSFPFTLSAGGSTAVSLAQYTDEPAYLFAVHDSDFYSISKTACNMDSVSATQITGLLVSAAETDGAITVNSDGAAISGGTRCNVTVKSGDTLLYAAEHLATGGTLPLALKIAADVQSLSVTGGLPVEVCVWGASSKAQQAVVVPTGVGGNQGASGPVSNTETLVELRKAVAGIIQGNANLDYDSDGQYTTEDLIILRKLIAGLE